TRRSSDLLQTLQEDLDLTYLFIAHDISVVRHISDRIGVMYLGKIVEEAPTDSLIKNPLHPYTEALLSAVPMPNPKVKKDRIILKGDIPSPLNPPKGCVFHTRCPYAMDICKQIEPEKKEKEEGHYVACHLYNEEHMKGGMRNEEKDEGGNVSGELRVAHNAQPPTLDPHMTTAGVTSDMSRIAFETLLTVDFDYQPMPMLAESVEESDENKVFTFHLREGVTFHNGKEMTAEDVVASMNRWLERSGVASEAFGNASFEEVDEYTVVLELEESSSIALDVLASKEQFAAIMPKEVIDEADAEGVKDLIGTGPYEFVEWKHDQYVHFTKFDDYQSVDVPADGLGGKKEALVKDIYFDIVTDASTRVAGIQSGEYDIAFAIPFESYAQLM